MHCICFRKTSGSNMGAANLLRAPSSLVTPVSTGEMYKGQSKAIENKQIKFCWLLRLRHLCEDALIHFRTCFSFGKSRGGWSRSMIRNTSRYSVVFDGFAGSTLKRDQANLEMQSLHLVFGRPLGCFPMDVASRICLANLHWFGHVSKKYSGHKGRTNVARVSRFGGEVAWYSRFYEFHSCALCYEVSHCEFFGKLPPFESSRFVTTER